MEKGTKKSEGQKSISSALKKFSFDRWSKKSFTKLSNGSYASNKEIMSGVAFSDLSSYSKLDVESLYKNYLEGLVGASGLVATRLSQLCSRGHNPREWEEIPAVAEQRPKGHVDDVSLQRLDTHRSVVLVRWFECKRSMWKPVGDTFLISNKKK